MFVDDKTVIKAGGNTDSLIREDVRVMTQYFDANKRTINVDTCEAIRFEGSPLMKFYPKTTSYSTKPVINT